MKHRTRSILSLLLALLLSFGLISCNSEPTDISGTTSGTNAPIVNAPACTEHRWLDASCTNPKTCLACGETEGEKVSDAHAYIEKDGVYTCV